MKKVLMIISTILLILLVSCKEEESNIVFKDKYEVGDVIEVDNIIYTYTNLLELGPFSFNDETPDSCYRYYYTDMSNKNQPEITGYDSHLFDDVKYRDVYLSPEAYYYDFHNRSLEGDYRANSFGFLVTSCNKDLEGDVVIPSMLGEHLVIGIGINAFKDSKIKSLTLEYSDTNRFNLIHPYAISNCPNLEFIKLNSEAVCLSMAISDCPKLKEITNLNAYFDCTLYNLESLETINNFNDGFVSFINWYELDNVKYQYFAQFPHYLSGQEKSVFYLCPNIKNLNTRDDYENYYFWIGNVLYYHKIDMVNNICTFYPIYVRKGNNQIIYLSLKNFTRISSTSFAVKINAKKEVFYLPCINNGYEDKYKIFPIDIDYNDVLLEENKITLTLKHSKTESIEKIKNDTYRLTLYGNYDVMFYERV